MRHAALRDEELWVGEMRALEIEGQRVLLLRTDAGIFAYEDRCPHLGFPLSRGKLCGSRLICSAHRYEYDAHTGRGHNPRDLQLRSFCTSVVAGAILVEVREDRT